MKQSFDLRALPVACPFYPSVDRTRVSEKPWRSAVRDGQAGIGVGQESAVLTADPALLAHCPNLSVGGVFLALGLRYDTVLAPKSGLEDAFHHSRKSLSQTLHIFSPRHLNDLGHGAPSSPSSVPYSGTGPRERNLVGMTLVFLPLSATGSCTGGWERYYVSQFKRLNHQAEHSHRRPTRLPTHRQVTEIAR